MEAVEHKPREFKVDTLPDWQPVEDVAYCWRDAVELPSASYQSRRGVEYTLQLPQVDVVRSNQNAIAIVEPTDDQSID